MATVRLPVAKATTAVEVTETAVSMDTTSSLTDTTITSKSLDIFTKGRTFNSILAIAPGVRYELKSGSNQFYGMATLEETGAPLNASDRGYWQRNPTNNHLSNFYARKKDDYSILYPTFTLGGPIVNNQLFFYVGYNPEIENTHRTIAYTSEARTFDSYYLRNYLVGKVDYQASSKLTVNSSWLWSPVRRQGTLPNRNARVAAPTNELSIQGGYRPAQSYNASATYTLSPRLITLRFPLLPLSEAVIPT